MLDVGLCFVKFRLARAAKMSQVEADLQWCMSTIAKLVFFFFFFFFFAYSEYIYIYICVCVCVCVCARAFILHKTER